MAAPMPTAALAPVRDGTITANAGAPARPPTRADDEARGEPGRIVLRAPMVGTFYRRPSPQEPPFVNVGSQIKKGDPLCLIEVMKLYTTIEAPADGVIELIGADDAALVEFDQLLFAIRPA